MKVKDLVAKLVKLDPNLDVVCYCEDDRVQKTGVSVLEIVSLDVVEAEKKRLPDGVGLIIGKTSNSAKHLVFEVTSEG